LRGEVRVAEGRRGKSFPVASRGGPPPLRGGLGSPVHGKVTTHPATFEEVGKKKKIVWCGEKHGKGWGLITVVAFSG